MRLFSPIIIVYFIGKFYLTSPEWNKDSKPLPSNTTNAAIRFTGYWSFRLQQEKYVRQ